MEQKYKKYVFFRDDDVGRLTPKFRDFLDIFISNRLPVHLAVVPDELTRDCADFILSLKGKDESLIEVGQHGFTHADRSCGRNSKRKYEFGPKRTYLLQKKDISRGRKTLENSFKKKIRVFTPPWHGYDGNTLKCLFEENIPVISLSSREIPGDLAFGIKAVTIDINFNKRRSNGRWFVQDNMTTLKRIINGRQQVAGVLFHHDKFSGRKDFISLAKLLILLKNSGCLEFIPLSTAAGLCKTGGDVIDRAALIYYLTYQFVPKPYTLISSRLNAACNELDYAAAPKAVKGDESFFRNGLYKKLKEAIKERLPQGNAPVGLLLSGGLDSAAILCALRDLTDRKIYTLTAAYHEGAANIGRAAILARQLNSIHDTLIIKPQELKKIDELYSGGQIAQPVGDDGLLPVYLMLKRLKDDCKYIFAGDGADCLFSGLKMHLFGLAGNRRKGQNDEFEHYRFGEIFLSRQELGDYFGRKYASLDQAAPFRDIADRVPIKDDILKRQVVLDLNFLVKNRIDYLTYPAGLCNIDLFLPFLERGFAEYALKIPGSYLIRGKEQKYILKKTFQERLPWEVVYQQKDGFGVPFALWYKANREFVIRRLVMSIRSGIPKDYIKYLISLLPRSANRNIGMRIWLIINLVSWQRGFRRQSYLNARGSGEK